MSTQSIGRVKMKLQLIQYFMCIGCSILLIERLVSSDTTPNPHEEDNMFERADEVDLRNSTTLLSLDSYIYNVIVDPTKGTGKELVDKLELLTHCLRKVRTMFLPENEDKDYAMRAAALIFFNSGGATFSRIPLYNDENTLPLKQEYNWTDEDIRKLEEKQNEAERAWSNLRKVIL